MLKLRSRIEIILYVLIAIITLFIPTKYGFHKYIFMYPYFVVGYLWNKYSFNKHYSCLLSKRKEMVLFLGVLISFLLLLSKYSYEDYIYTTMTSVIKKASNGTFFFSRQQLIIDLFRFTIGFIGSATILLLIKIFMDIYKSDKYYCPLTRICSALGRNALGMYIIGGVIQMYFLPMIPFRNELGYVAIVLESIIVLFVAYFLSKLIKAFKTTNNLFFGW